MRVLVTGSARHLGEAHMRTLRGTGAEAIDIDLKSSPFTDHLGSVSDRPFLTQRGWRPLPGLYEHHERVRACEGRYPIE